MFPVFFFGSMCFFPFPVSCILPVLPTPLWCTFRALPLEPPPSESIFPPVFGRRLQAQTVRNGDRVVLDVEVSGTPEPSVAWFKDGRPVQEAFAPGSYALQQVGPCFKLIFEQVSLNGTGTYMVLATNAGGEAQSTADIAVLQCESAAQPAPQPAPQKHVSFVDMVQQQQVNKRRTRLCVRVFSVCAF